MDRVGLFKEMGYVTINDKYKERGGKQIVYHWDAHLHLKCSHTYIHHTCLVQGNYSFCGLELFVYQYTAPDLIWLNTTQSLFHCTIYTIFFFYFYPCTKRVPYLN